MPNPWCGVRGAGDPSVGASLTVRAVGGAGSSSASPSANPAGRRKRFTACGESPVACMSAAAAPSSVAAPRQRSHPRRPSRSRRPRVGATRHRRSRLWRRFQPTVPGLVCPDGQRHRLRARPGARPVKQAIWAANQIVGMPYRLGGGHSSASPTAPTTARAPSPPRCTAPVCWPRPATPRRFMRYGAGGKGPWITVYTNPGHAFASSRGCAWTRARPATPPAARAALAPEPALDARLPRPPPACGSS